ncbi:MAG: DNA polymerase II [Chitinispirillales bacterium]|jgi:DNA polymerase-2|nr:DNA polymerase II [Chitinispirillales bacterium]
MANSTLNCFLLTAHYRDSGRKFEITLWAAGGSGERARILVDDFRPMFFCPRSVPGSETEGAQERKPLPMRSFDMREVDCLYFDTHAQMLQTARRMRANGHRVYESDVNPLSRYLMERMVSGSMRVAGEPMRQGAFANFKNPHLRGCEFIPELRVMSICVDAGEGEELRRIGCAEDNRETRFALVDQRLGDDRQRDGGNNQYGDNRQHGNNREPGSGHPKIETRQCKDEHQLLTDFLTYIKQRDPDVIIGWKAAGFTLRILQERCTKHGIRFEIGRENGSRVASSERRREWRGGGASTKTVWTARVPGRVVMDVPTMLRAYNRSADDCHIDFTDCLTGAKDILNIFTSADILPNAIERSRRSGQTLDGTGGSVASFDHLYLPRLHRAGFAAIDTADIAQPTKPLPGGYVLEPTPGLYDNVLVFDFKSLYPSIIMTFMIDPLGFKIDDADRIKTPIGTTFSKNTSIMPEIIRELMAARALAVQLKNPYLSQAIKILMNSFAGVLASTGCRFFSDEVSPSITLTGQYILKSSIEHIENSVGKKVIYGDTDSIFVNMGKEMKGNANEIGAKISKETGVWLRERLLEDFGVKSALELKYENHYRHFFIPSLRGGDTGLGTKKHYCGAEVNSDGAMELTFKGMESARSDWTDLAKEFQHELFIRFFSGKPLEDYVIATAEHLQRGDFDQKLIYRKRVRKELGDYTTNIPPHVQAAKLLDTPVRAIRYYITKNGPQPVEKLSAPLDYQHYIDCQLRPIADSILVWMGADFDNLVSGQQELF